MQKFYFFLKISTVVQGTVVDLGRGGCDDAEVIEETIEQSGNKRAAKLIIPKHFKQKLLD